MKDHRQSIAIRALPEQLNAIHQSALYRELESCINVDRPAVVFDCSALRQLDKGASHFLLCCLEEAIKRNGDVRLAAMRPDVNRTFQSTGLDHIFQTFDSIGDAVESFRVLEIGLVRQGNSVGKHQHARDNAAQDNAAQDNAA